MHKSQAGFDQPPADDTSYEADALQTKPPRLDLSINIIVRLSSEKCQMFLRDKKTFFGSGFPYQHFKSFFSNAKPYRTWINYFSEDIFCKMHDKNKIYFLQVKQLNRFYCGFIQQKNMFEPPPPRHSGIIFIILLNN